MKDRERFNNWARKAGLNLERYDNGAYVEIETSLCWSAWQGCDEQKDKEIAELRKCIEENTEALMGIIDSFKEDMEKVLEDRDE